MTISGTDGPKTTVIYNKEEKGTSEGRPDVSLQTLVSVDLHHTRGGEVRFGVGLGRPVPPGPTIPFPFFLCISLEEMETKR